MPGAKTVPADTCATELTSMEGMLRTAQEELAKFKGGNNAAGTRLRKSMQDIKGAAQRIRESVTQARKA